MAGALALYLACGQFGGARAAEQVDLDVVAKIRQEAFSRSQAAANLKELTETVGPRLTNSPSYVRATEWAQDKLRGWGLSNVHDEVYDPAFGRGWEFGSAKVELLSPRRLPIHALPKAWTRGTNGPVEGELAIATFKELGDIDKQKGKLLLAEAARQDRAGRRRARVQGRRKGRFPPLQRYRAG